MLEIIMHDGGELLLEVRCQPVIASDLARLFLLQKKLEQGYDTVIWTDADFLIFNPAKLIVPDQPYSVGREIWVQYDKQEKLKVYKKVHNAFLMFRHANNFLPFYIETAERLLRLNQGSVPPQFIGPKLLTAIHNISILPVMETAGMLSPLVVKDLIQGKGRALELFSEHSPEPIVAANLCISSCEKNEISDQEMIELIDKLRDNSFMN